MVKHMGYFDHECYLSLSPDTCGSDIPIYMSNFKKWFFSLKKYTIIDENSPKTRRYFRSYASIVAEKKRHTKRSFSRIIHPFSKVAIFKERFICILWMIAFFTEPLEWSIFLPCDGFHDLYVIESVMENIFRFNAVLTLFTGYCDRSSKEIVLSPRKIIRNKLFSFVLPEILCTIPYKHIQISIFGVNPRKSRATALSVIRILRYLRLLDMIRYFSNILEDLSISETLSTIMIVFFMAFYLIHWSACAMYFISISYYTWEDLPRESWFKNTGKEQDEDSLYLALCTDISTQFLDSYVVVIIGATCHFFGASEGYTEIVLPIEKLMCAFVLILGFIYYNYSMAKMFELFGSVNISESKYQALLLQVPDYIRTRNLPPYLKKKMFLYYEYKFQGKFFKEEEILGTLSEHLRCEVVLNSCENILKKIPLLQGMSKSVVGSVIGFLKREIYLPNDVVVKCGDPLAKMFWVSYGTFAVYFGDDMIEILHFEDGDHFCDDAITATGGYCTLSVVALEITEVFTLDRKDIKHCTTFLKEMTEKVNKLRKEKSRLYSYLVEKMTDREVQSRVLADLRKGRILERDRWRRKRYDALKTKNVNKFGATM